VLPVLVLRPRPAFVFGPRFTRAEATTAAATGA